MNSRLYYYDFLSEETRGGIPENALEHMTQCLNCQDEMDRLKALFERVDERIASDQSRKDSAISTLLRLHFAYVGEPVSCSTVKPFLASLADPVLQIRIPTPITMHLDECRACRDDLLELRDLCLTHKQLCRLGRLLGDEPAEDAVNCSQARAAIPTVMSMAFRDTDAEILKHLCTCPDCRKQLYLHREEVRLELPHNEMAQNELPCESVSATDIYDYCLPYGIDPADDQFVEFRESLTSHLRSCPTCLEKMQGLYNTVYGIAERSDSGVVACFTFQQQVDVQVPDQTELTDAGHTKALHLKRYIKPAIAAAAVILIGFALLLSTPAAKAVDLGQVYEALEKVTNVCISRFVPYKAEPTQKVWSSKTLNIKMFETDEQFVLWDFAEGIKRTKPSNASAVQSEPLPLDVVTEGKESLGRSLGLLPFSNVNEALEGTQWNRAGDQDIEAPIPDTEVYDLTWKTTDGMVTEYHRWRVFIDTQRNLPKKTMWYEKTPIDDEYTLYSIEEVAYPHDSEIKAVIQNTFD
jgi:hypothetical protein